ncbi:MAG: hypothetical protein JWO30_3146 [Fibrobacteres bacterium]|nr:hypothetical protein [Fibrobacterota bacterium]
MNRTTFIAETRTLDFLASDAAAIINKWVADKTNNLIPEIVRAPLDPDLVMMLINALYFKGNWSKQFDPTLTYDGIFHLADGTEKACRMMSADAPFRFFQDDKTRGLELPYGDSLFSMVLLQPVDSAGLPGLISDLTQGGLEGWDGKFIREEGPVHVPKFKLEYGKTLSDELKAMGMASAFRDDADFSGIRPGGQLQISEVIHKTFVSVDETGTEAAAVTAVGIRTTALHLDLVRFDRPFLVVIREKTSGTILFPGAYHGSDPIIEGFGGGFPAMLLPSLFPSYISPQTRGGRRPEIPDPPHRKFDVPLRNSKPSRSEGRGP